MAQKLAILQESRDGTIEPILKTEYVDEVLHTQLHAPSVLRDDFFVQLDAGNRVVFGISKSLNGETINWYCQVWYLPYPIDQDSIQVLYTDGWMYFIAHPKE